MKIILVRHGESEHNAKTTENYDSPLTKKGIAQAKHLGIKLKKDKVKIDSIYTSTLIRSKQTAEIISKITKVQIKKRFKEFDEYESPHVRNPLIRLISPRLRALKNLLKSISKNRIQNKTILIVAHGRTNRIIMTYLLRIPLNKSIMRFSQHNTGLSVLSWNEQYRNWTLESMNELSHIPRRLKK